MTTRPGATERGAGGTAEGRLPENIVHFVRALRKAGIRVGNAQVLTAIRAVQAAGFTEKGDFRAILRATMITRAEHLQVFDQIFSMFWRDPEYLEKMIQMLSPALKKEGEDTQKKKDAARRALDSLTDDAPPPNLPERDKDRDELEIDAKFSWSASERLARKDFEQMSNAELAAAKAALRQLRLPVPQILSRRRALAPRGAVDLRTTLRQSLRRGGDPIDLARRALVTRPPVLVALCDISGSMSIYSRILLHFLHALSQDRTGGWGRVHAFTFGTELTNIPRALEKKDPDAALGSAGQMAGDWEGGTRIGTALDRFNRDWSRRVLAEGAAVLLISDGLERGDLNLLERAAERLHLSCRRLIWLNPLLRFDAFEARASGVRTLLPHVDSFHACHSLDSLAGLASALSGPGDKARLLAA